MSDPFTSKEFESDGVHEGPSHIGQWFPKKGVKMTFRRFEVTNPKPGFSSAYYKATISDTPSRPMIQNAVYIQDGANRLLAMNMEAGAGSLLHEAITAVLNGENKIVLRHELLFSNGDMGIWTCK